MVNPDVVTQLYSSMRASDRTAIINDLNVIIEFLNGTTTDAYTMSNVMFSNTNGKTGTITVTNGARSYTITYNAR